MTATRSRESSESSSSSRECGVITTSRALAETLRIASVMAARTSDVRRVDHVDRRFHDTPRLERTSELALLDAVVETCCSRSNKQSGAVRMAPRSAPRNSTTCDSVVSRGIIIEPLSAFLDPHCKRSVEMGTCRDFSGRPAGIRSSRLRLLSIDCIEKWDYTLRGASEFLYNSSLRRNGARSSPVWSLGRTAQKHVSTGRARLGCLASFRAFQGAHL